LNANIIKPLQWKQEALPSDYGNVISPQGISIKDIAVAIDGMTIWACPGKTVPFTVYKSTNTGATWTAVHINNLGSTGINADLVAIAPDNSNCIAICDTSALIVYFSSNGGATWTSLGIPRGTGVNPIAVINDIAFSTTITGGVQYIAIAGQDSNNQGNVWYYNLGSITGTWRATNPKDGSRNNSTSDARNVKTDLAVAFSPNFAADLMMLAITADNTNNNIKLHVYSFNSATWDSAVYPKYPVELNTLSKPISEVTHVSIALAPDYFGGDEFLRIAFIGIDTGGTHADGIYRVINNTVTHIMSNTRIYSLAYDGSTLVAGQTNSTSILRSLDPLSSTPTIINNRAIKCPGGTEKTIVALAGTNVIASTSGPMSAFAISWDTGVSFNDISLINTTLTNLEDVAVSNDGKIIYLVTDDTLNTSVWRSNEGSWKRVLNLNGVRSFLVRIAPTNPNIVYIVSKTTTDIYFSKNGGLDRWYRRNGALLAADFAVESDDIAYIGWGTNVLKTSNSGFTWGLPINTQLLSGEIYTLCCISEGNLIVGGTTGCVSYSNDGNKTWNPITKVVTPLATNVQVTANGLDSDKYIFASVANKSGVWRWKVGQAAKESWYQMDTVGVPQTGSGIVLQNSILYESSSNGAVRRCTSPTMDSPQVLDNISTGALVFSKAPSALRVSATSSIKLWAIDAVTMMLYSYDDPLVLVKTRIVDIERTGSKPLNRKIPIFTPTHKFEYDVALSYASEDIKFPESLAAMLRGQGVRVFFDKYFEPELWGKDLDKHFTKVFKDNALYCIVFISQNYIKKIWSIHEFKAARARAIKEPDKEYILPIKLDDTDISSLLPNIGWKDIRKTSVEAIADWLIKKLQSYVADD
jgi:photosystem II stability/assembly factor-like uncharacterized protein